MNKTSKVVRNPVVQKTVRDSIIAMLSRRKTGWQGTMTELLEAISDGRKTPEVWPTSGSSLRQVVNTIVPTIRKAGYRVEFSRTSNHERRRLVSFSRSSK